MTEDWVVRSPSILIKSLIKQAAVIKYISQCITEAGVVTDREHLYIRKQVKPMEVRTKHVRLVLV